MGQYTQAVQQLYVAYFNRPADPAGLTYWEGVVSAIGGDVSPISAAFSRSPEYLSVYAGKTNTQVVNQVYLNLFGRPAEAGGSAYWTDLLNRKLITIDNVVAQVARGAQGSDLVAYDSKVTAASAFTAGLNTGEKAESYNGETINLAKSFISGVSDFSSMNTAIAPATLQATINFMRATFDGKHHPGSEFSLSNDIDMITPSTSQPLKGNDIFRTTDLSLGPADNINGGDGLDTLIINSGQRDTYTLPNASNIINFETIDLNTAGQFAGNLNEFTGLNQFSLHPVGGATLSASSTTNIRLATGLGADSIVINGGNDISLTVNAATTGPISVGTMVAPKGTVTVRSDYTGNEEAGAITIRGGRTVEVIQTHSNLGTNASNSAITVLGTADTTKVKVIGAPTRDGDINISQNRITISDINHGHDIPGTISTVEASGYTTLTLNGNAFSRVSLADVNDAVTTLNDQGSTLTTLDLSLDNANTRFVESANTLKTININATGRSVLYSLDAQSVETINVTGSGSVFISPIAIRDGLSKLNALKQINVTGSGGFAGDFSNFPVALIDASKSEGGTDPERFYYTEINALQTSYLGGSGSEEINAGFGINQKIALGAGNDILHLSTAFTIGNGVIVDGGSGRDALWLGIPDQSAAIINNGGKITGFETIFFTNTMIWPEESLDIANFVGQSEVVISKPISDIVLENWNPAASLGLIGINKQIRLENTSFLTGNNDTVKILLHAQMPQTYASDGIRARYVENVVIERGNTPDFIKNFEGDFSDNNPVAQLTLLGNDLKTITLTGKSTQYDLSAASSALASLDASALAGGSLKFTAGSLTAAISVKGVANGNNTLNLSAATKGITYSGGAGADDITLGSGNNIISVGKGADVVTLLAPGSSAGSFTTIKDLHAGMTLAIDGHASTSFNRSMVSLSSSASFQDYLNAVVHQSNDSASEGVFGWFQYKGDSYLVESRHSASGSAANFVDGTDLIVKLTGLHNLANASFSSEGTFVF